jgi:hypothetical protein
MEDFTGAQGAPEGEISLLRTDFPQGGCVLEFIGR